MMQRTFDFPIEVPLFIDGQRLQEGAEPAVESRDPATGEVVALVAQAGEEHVDEAVAAARRAFDSRRWCGLKPIDRGRAVIALAEAIRDRADELAAIEVHDGGKPLRDARGEVELAARFFEFYGSYADKIQGSSIPLGDGWMDWTIREPIGVSAQIVPWNYSLGVMARGVAPALSTGCSVVIKPSTETPLAINLFGELCAEVGIPEGVVNIIPGRGSVAGAHLAAHEDIDQITFTGSEATGKTVMASAADHVVPVVLELGGKSPQLILDDADLSAVLPVLVNGMYAHAGQVCNAGTRLVAQAGIHDRVVDQIHDVISGWRLGHGMDDPDMGPLVSRPQREAVLRYYDLAESEGQVRYGADLPDDPELAEGNFVRPAIVTGVDNNDSISREEVFGPLLTALTFEDLDEGIQIANDSPYGLVAGVFTTNLNKAMYATERLRAGQIWINEFYAGYDVEFPFGGYKRSGFGREKGIEGVNAYLQVKNVCARF